MAKQADFTHIERAARTRRIAGKVVVYALLTAWALMVLFPFYWMILSSLKSYSAYNAEYIPKFYTLSPTLENYVEAFTCLLYTSIASRSAFVIPLGLRFG